MRKAASPLSARRRILKAAAEMFNTAGFAATTIADIQKAAQVQRGTLYFHFPSKEGLALEVLDDFFASVAATLEAAIKNSGASSRQALFDAFGVIRRQAVENGFRGGCLLGNFGQELSSGDETARLKMKGLFERLVTAVALLLALARRQGELPSSVEPRAAARLFISAFHGALIELKVYRDPAVYDECMDTLALLFKEAG